MKRTVFLDVEALPHHAFGSRSPMWWGTVAFMVIEGAMFAMLVATYVYLRGAENVWPPPGFAPPSLLWGSLNTAILLASLWPNHKVHKAVEELDVSATRRWMLVGDLFAVMFLAVRVLELGGLNVRWDSNAYGSIVWLVMGFHTFHLLTDAVETLVLTGMMYTIPSERRMVDVSDDTLYWNFVVLVWLPLYVVVYWLPRWL
ncbi:MAG TPA: cytochrome c oxidase subunit 3 [Thermoanaerobaculia bacterium]|nr:cytochrome c oxidase subunit 3 [Thermoanaerobaculia bacterium]